MSAALHDQYLRYMQERKKKILATARTVDSRVYIEEIYQPMDPTAFEIFFAKLPAKQKADFEEEVNKATPPLAPAKKR